MTEVIVPGRTKRGVDELSGRDVFRIGLAGVWGIILSFLFSLAAHAQSDNQLWTAVFSNGPLTEDNRLYLWFDSHARFSENASRLGVSIIRPGIGYRLSSKLTLWAGYARVVNRADGRADINEDRIWQQATYPILKGSFGQLVARTRLEQRMLSTGTETSHRLRQSVRWLKPLDGKWSVTAANELFLNLNETSFGIQSGFDQNRLFIGLRLRASKTIRVEGGYLMNHLRRNNITTVNHNASLSIIAPF